MKKCEEMHRRPPQLSGPGLALGNEWRTVRSVKGATTILSDLPIGFLLAHGLLLQILESFAHNLRPSNVQLGGFG